MYLTNILRDSLFNEYNFIKEFLHIANEINQDLFPRSRQLTMCQFPRSQDLHYRKVFSISSR